MLLSYTMLDAPQSFMYGSMYSCGKMLVCATFSPNSGCSGFHVWQYVQVWWNAYARYLLTQHLVNLKGLDMTVCADVAKCLRTLRSRPTLGGPQGFSRGTTTNKGKMLLLSTTDGCPPVHQHRDLQWHIDALWFRCEWPGIGRGQLSAPSLHGERTRPDPQICHQSTSESPAAALTAQHSAAQHTAATSAAASSTVSSKSVW